MAAPCHVNYSEECSRWRRWRTPSGSSMLATSLVCLFDGYKVEVVSDFVVIAAPLCVYDQDCPYLDIH
jgi:hypothetical protein